MLNKVAYRGLRRLLDLELRELSVFDLNIR